MSNKKQIENIEESKVWFTSDLHLDHLNMVGPKVSKWKSGYRDFNSLSEMNETIITNINKYVKWNDILYFLGDFCFKTHKKIPYWRNRINCQTINCLIGNHDKHILDYKELFNSIQHYLEIKEKDKTFILFHYPLLSWWHIGHGNIHLHGHVHANKNIMELNKKCKRLDVGIDNAYKIFGEYRPFSINETIELTNKNPIFSPDYH